LKGRCLYKYAGTPKQTFKLARGDNIVAQNDKTPVELAHRSSPVFSRRSNMPDQSINVPDEPVSDSQYFRDLAGKTRAKADQALHYGTKQLLLRIAETYERVADRVDQRVPDAEKPN
jgi:hypothetical protein